MHRTSTTYYIKDTPGVARFFSRDFAQFCRKFLGSLTGRPSVTVILSIDFFAALYYSKDRKRARYQQTVTPSSCHCKMTASFAGLGGHFAYVRNNPAKNKTKIAMRSIFAYTAFTPFHTWNEVNSPPFSKGMEDKTAYRCYRLRAEKFIFSCRLSYHIII